MPLGYLVIFLFWYRFLSVTMSWSQRLCCC